MPEDDEHIMTIPVTTISDVMIVNGEQVTVKPQTRYIVKYNTKTMDIVEAIEEGTKK